MSLSKQLQSLANPLIISVQHLGDIVVHCLRVLHEELETYPEGKAVQHSSLIEVTRDLNKLRGFLTTCFKRIFSRTRKIGASAERYDFINMPITT